MITLFVLAFAMVSQAAPSSAESALNQQLSYFRTYVAAFAQKTFDGRGRLLQQGRGRVMIMRPGFFRWETNTPTRQILMTDSKMLWVYDIDLAQATQQRLNNKTTINPALLLSGSVENLQQQFNVYLKEADVKQVFLLTPKQNDMSFKSIWLNFAQDRLIGMRVLNNLDETSEYQFTDIKINVPLAVSLFKFKAPRGVDIVNQ
jgi:outer membrane lipoprotein carrier protein